MANFLFIHGAAHGAWCWDRVLPRLTDLGHTATAIDLPAAGADTTPAKDVTIQAYVQKTVQAMKQKTILVGHSLGGLTITLAAATAPEKTKALVYLCALVPEPGKAFTDIRNGAIDPEVSDAQTVDREAGVSHVVTEKAADLFYNDCTAEDQAFALERLSPQPISVMTERLEFTPPTAPKHYIRCLQDRVVYPQYQTTISEGWSHTYDLPTGHSPFLSHPGDLTTLLHQIARTHD